MTSPADADPASETTAPDWFTAALAAPVQERLTTVEGTAIAYRAWGNPADRGIVLVHGGAAHSRWWDHIGPLLANGWRGVALGPSRHGASRRAGRLHPHPAGPPAPRQRRAFGPLLVYRTRQAAMARFHPVPDQPVLAYIADHVAATSIRPVEGGRTRDGGRRSAATPDCPPLPPPAPLRVARAPRARFSPRPHPPAPPLRRAPGAPPPRPPSPGR